MGAIVGPQKRKIAVPSMPSEPAPPMETRCRRKARIHLPGAGGNMGAIGGAMPMETRCRARPESIYRGPKPLVLARLVTGAGTNSSVNGFGPCPASGFHGRGQLGRHARHRDLPFRGSRVPSCPGTRSSVNGFRPCPASGFHGHGWPQRHAKDCDLPFRGPHVPEYGLV